MRGHTVLDYIAVAAFGCLILPCSFLDHCRDGCCTEFAIPLFGYGFDGCPPPLISLHPTQIRQSPQGCAGRHREQA